MSKVNYKEDFEFVIRDSEGKFVEFPTHDFTIDLWTWGSKCKYTASFKGGVCTNLINEDGTIRVIVNNHHFVPGKLVAEIRQYLPSETMPDGTMKIYRYMADTGIELVRENVVPTELDALAIFAYTKGEPFTYEDFTEEQIADLMRPATDAAAACEATRVLCEKQTEKCSTATDYATTQAENAQSMANLAATKAEQANRAVITATAILPVFVSEVEYDALVNEGNVREDITYYIYEDE